MRSQFELHQDLASMGETSPVIKVKCEWLRRRLRRFQPLVDRLDLLRRDHRYSIVYAIRFREEDVPHFDSVGWDTIFRDNIPPDRFVGKAIVYGDPEALRDLSRREHSDMRRYDSLMNMWTNWKKEQQRKAPTMQESPRISRMWRDLATRDLDAGVDLTEDFRGDALRQYLESHYPGILDGYIESKALKTKKRSTGNL